MHGFFCLVQTFIDRLIDSLVDPILRLPLSTIDGSIQHLVEQAFCLHQRDPKEQPSE
jgi:hypothetical protein